MLVQGDEVSTILRLDDLILGRYYLMRPLLVRIRSRIHPFLTRRSIYLSGAVVVLNIQLTLGHSIPSEVLHIEMSSSQPCSTPTMPSLLTGSVKSLCSHFHYLPNLDSLLLSILFVTNHEVSLSHQYINPSYLLFSFSNQQSSTRRPSMQLVHVVSLFNYISVVEVSTSQATLSSLNFILPFMFSPTENQTLAPVVKAFFLLSTAIIIIG